MEIRLLFSEKACHNIIISRHEAYWFCPIVITTPKRFRSHFSTMDWGGELKPDLFGECLSQGVFGVFWVGWCLGQDYTIVGSCPWDVSLAANATPWHRLCEAEVFAQMQWHSILWSRIKLLSGAHTRSATKTHLANQFNICISLLSRQKTRHATFVLYSCLALELDRNSVKPSTKSRRVVVVVGRYIRRTNMIVLCDDRTIS